MLTGLWFRGLSGHKLGTVDELGEIGLVLVRSPEARQGPFLRFHLTAHLHVNDLNLFAVFQSLCQTNRQILHTELLYKLSRILLVSLYACISCVRV